MRAVRQKSQQAFLLGTRNVRASDAYDIEAVCTGCFNESSVDFGWIAQWRRF